MTVSRRNFVGGIAAALGYLGVDPDVDLFAQTQSAAGAAPRARGPMDEYDSFAKLASNENNYGPPESVMKAMNNAWKYSNRYGYPDGNIHQEIAKHHGVKNESILLTAGSGEVLDVIGTTFLQNGKKVLGVEPSYSSVYQHATSIKSTAIKLPLGKDYRQDIPAMIKAANTHAERDRARLSVQPEQPDRADRHQAGSEAAARRHPEGHAGAHRRGVSPLRRRPELRDLGAVRPRRAPGDHRAHLLEDRGARRHAPRLRDRDAGDHRRRCGRTAWAASTRS